MKINTNVNNAINIYSRTSKAYSIRKNRETAKDSVEISKEGREVSKYIELAKNTETRNEKVEEIKKLISENKYHIDSEKLAKSLMNYIKESEK